MQTKVNTCPPEYQEYTNQCRRTGKYPLMYQLWTHQQRKEQQWQEKDKQ